VIVPSNHQILSSEFKNDAKRHGKLSTIGDNKICFVLDNSQSTYDFSEEPQAVKLVMQALPFIQAYIKHELERSRLQNPNTQLIQDYFSY